MMKDRVKDEKRFAKQLNKTHDEALNNGKCIGVLDVIGAYAKKLNVDRQAVMNILGISKEEQKRYLKAEQDEESYSLSVNISQMCRDREKIINTAVKVTDVYCINRVIVMLEIEANEAMDLLDISEMMRKEYPRSQIYNVCAVLEEYGNRDISMSEGEEQSCIMDTLAKHFNKLINKKKLSPEQAMKILNIPESYENYFRDQIADESEN